MKTKHNPAMRAIFISIAALFWMLVLSTLLTSCAPKRTLSTNTATNTARTEKVDSTFQNRETKNEEQKTETNSQRTLLDIENLTDEWQIRHRTFDATLPLDSASGLPPIVSETIITRKRTGSKHQALTDNVKEKTDSKLSEEIKQTGEYKKAVKEIEKTVERTKEKEKPPTLFIVFWLVAVLLSVVLVVYLVNTMNKKPY